jgi:hypothetical protein
MMIDTDIISMDSLKAREDIRQVSPSFAALS